VTDNTDLFQTGLTMVCRQYQSSTAAATVSRIPPVFRATVSAVSPASGTPTRTVEFYVGDDLVCSDELDGSGVARCSSLQSLLSLHQDYTAVYVGDGVFAPSEDQGSFFP